MDEIRRSIGTREEEKGEKRRRRKGTRQGGVRG